MSESKLGPVLRELRKSAGLSQFEVAVQSGVGLATYQHLEQGKVDDGALKLATLRKLARLFSLKVSDLLRSIGE